MFSANELACFCFRDLLAYLMQINRSAIPNRATVLQERENRPPSLCVAKALGGSIVSRFDQPRRGDKQINFQETDIGQLLFPLPGGEGYGEGESHSN